MLQFPAANFHYHVVDVLSSAHTENKTRSIDDDDPSQECGTNQMNSKKHSSSCCCYSRLRHPISILIHEQLNPKSPVRFEIYETVSKLTMRKIRIMMTVKHKQFQKRSPELHIPGHKFSLFAPVAELSDSFRQGPAYVPSSVIVTCKISCSKSRKPYYIK